ncbi:glycosyltransferase family 2 protein [Marinobacter lacisalsi]|uniref:Glycosyltransferase family 2 protein n=1 Tax=Marinobacter lacisalsi TaxID=475979 RepID=A0ABV8QFF9_9GAMM
MKENLPLAANKISLEPKPFFSIIMPCFNSEAFLEQSIQSVLAQSEKDFELIIVDDGSTDNSVDIVQELAATDTRIRLSKNQGKSGASGARNRAADLARGEWLCFLDSDDKYTTFALGQRKKAISKLPECQFFSSNFFIWWAADKKVLPQTVNNPSWFQYFQGGKESGVKILDQDVVPVFIKHPLAWTGGVTITKSLFERLGGFDEELIRGEDDHLWIRASRVSSLVGLIERADAYYRQRPGSLSLGSASLSPYTLKMIKKLMDDPLFDDYRLLLKEKLDLEAYLLSLHFRECGDRLSALRFALESWLASSFSYRRFRNLIGAALLR